MSARGRTQFAPTGCICHDCLRAIISLALANFTCGANLTHSTCRMNFTAKGGRGNPSPTVLSSRAVGAFHSLYAFSGGASPSPTDCIYITIVSVTIAGGNHFTKRSRFISRPKVISSPKDISLRSSASLKILFSSLSSYQEG